MMEIREERGEDLAGIREVNRLAFGGEAEGRLVDRLRADGLVCASLVAVEAGEVVGHILFSRLAVETERGPVAAVALAPMAVRPDWQRRGMGSALVRRGLQVCRERGQDAVIVVGHPEYYPRFGFSAELARRFSSPYCGEAFMALELAPGALEGSGGTVRYSEAFSTVESGPFVLISSQFEDAHVRALKMGDHQA